MAGAVVALTVVAPTVEAGQGDDPFISLTEPVSDGPSPVEVYDAKARIDRLNRQLRALTPYVRTAPDHTQSFDLAAARAAGHDEGLLALAAELVEYQNALLAKARQARTGVQTPPVAPENYPEVAWLFSAASRAAVAELKQPESPARPLDLTTVDPCGDWRKPVPSAPVPRQLQGPHPDVEAALTRLGYHHTAGHACGHPNQLTCASDYTRGGGLRHAGGTCASPRFRDQAIPSYTMPGYVRVQYGEPNPEFETYGWPYWTWAAYVTWWHRHY